ncbi:MAG: HindIII family type II restriction endonuclease [Alphaproteobacteria bacterium]|nr:HindIII family type II restriction endonuclease [Alphaproteobacteria bacterium]
MQFKELQSVIKEKSVSCDFNTATDDLQNIIFSLPRENFLPLVSQIGSIPENIEHDSTEEKLYTKVSDIILAKCFLELNMKAIVLRERANSADVIAKSKFHNYSLVGDAKSFRLSRTAKNQKDFKVESMVHWRGENNFSVLCCPYFQYPKRNSQIYGSALDGNVSLFSWEYFSVLLKKNIQETSSINLQNLWNYSATIAETTSVSDKNVCFLEQQNEAIRNFLSISKEDFNGLFKVFKENIIARGNDEINYWHHVIQKINTYTKEEAIKELISALKLKEKIKAINKYITYLKDL